MKNSIFSSLIMGVLEEEVCGRGGGVNKRGLNKRNHGKIIEISENVSNVVLGTSSYNNNNN